MVYCPKCGTQNDDSAEFCVKCGASMQTGTIFSRRRERRRAEQECFGLPHGGAIAGIVFGIIILIWGITMLLQQTGIIAATIEFWYVIIIIIGILIVAGAIYNISRSQEKP
ncbi:MAG: zinc-ribbon domain-containing protein [Candidatus Bathyarchaeota archaeon]|nr:zinc-ribbon domain-containing protein [Candidatus Bathyarchaeota archaeon]